MAHFTSSETSHPNFTGRPREGGVSSVPKKNGRPKKVRWFNVLPRFSANMLWVELSVGCRYFEWSFGCYPPVKKTWPWKIPILCRKYIFQWSISHFYVSLAACKWFGSFCWPFLTSWKTLVRNSSGSIGRQQNNSWKWQQAGWAFQIASSFTGVFFSAPSIISLKNLQQTNVKQKRLTYSKKVFIMETWGESIWNTFRLICWTFHHFCPTNKKDKDGLPLSFEPQVSRPILGCWVEWLQRILS